MKNDIYLNENDKIYSDCLKQNHAEFLKLFNSFTDNLIKHYEPKDTLLFLNTFHRNTYSSTIVNELKQLFVFTKLSKTSGKSTFYTDSKNIFNLLKTKNVNIVFNGNEPSIFRKKTLFVIFLLLQHIFLKFFCRNNDLEIKSNSIYFEVFESCSDSSQIGTHYYPQLLHTDFAKKTEIRFLVSLLNFNSIKKYFLLRRKLLQSKIPITITDFNYKLSCIRTFWKRVDKEIKKIDKPFKFCKFDLSTLIKEKLLLEKFSRTSFNAYLRFKDIKENKLYNNSNIILWHENHGLDKATCLANSLREVKANIVGHQGFPPSVEKNCDRPSKIEIEKNLAPKRVYKLILSENNHVQDEIRAPAFRFHRIFGNAYKTDCRNSIAIAFPLTSKSKTINEIININNAFQNNGYDVRVKIHPLQSKKHIEIIKNNCNVIEDISEFYDFIKSSSVFISSGLTNMYYESFFLGRNSINLSTNGMNSHEFLMDTGFFHEISSFEEIKTIADLNQTIPEKVVRKYLGFFIEPNSDNIQSFLRDIESI